MTPPSGAYGKDLTPVPIAITGATVQPERGDGQATDRPRVRPLRPVHPDSTELRLARAMSAIERIRLTAVAEAYPIIERIASEAIDELQEEPQQ